MFLGLLLFTIVAVFAISVGEFKERSRSHIRQFPSWGHCILTIIIETPATCYVMTWWGLGSGGGGWFLESLRAVCPMSTLFAGPSLPVHNRAQFGWMPLSGLQGYALHSAAFRGTPASQAPLPTLFSVDEFKLGKCPVRGFPICVAWAHGIFFTAFLLRSRHCNRVWLSVFFLLPTLLPIVFIW